MKKNDFRRRLMALLVSSAVVFSAAGCAEIPGDSIGSAPQPAENIQVQQARFDEVKDYDPSGATAVTFSGSNITVDGTGCTVDGSTLTITREGTYILSGTLEGQVVVDADGEKIRLVLKGADITCPSSSPLYIKDAKKVTVTLEEGTENVLTDGAVYDYDDPVEEEPSAALFSKADLILEGAGALTVNAAFNNGIQSKDTLEIQGGVYTVTAANHGITGKDSLAIKDGSFAVTAGGDGLRSTKSGDSTLGWISIAGGSFAVNAGQDGFQAETTLHIAGGQFSVTTGGGSANSSTENENWGSWEQGGSMGPGGFGGHGGPGGPGGPGDPGGMPGRGGMPMTAQNSGSSSGNSAKAFKAGADVLIQGGSIVIDSSDDALHSNGDMTITGGDIAISSGDDGIHADATLVIGGGQTVISKSVEGIEGVSVTISGGRVEITSGDDGINSAGGTDGQSDRPGANMFAADDSCNVVISGGTVLVDASGDGIDSNGNIELLGGTLVLNGPTNSGNGPLDYAGECIVTGGSIAVSGSAGMAQGASSRSTQANMLLCFTDTVAGGTQLALTDSAGNVVFASTPAKDYASMFLSLPSMSVGDSYTLWLGGTCSGESAEGIYTGGTLSGAAEVAQVTVSQTSTYYGGYGGMGGPGR